MKSKAKPAKRKKTAEFTARQRAFIDEYLICRVGTQAAIRAGYSQRTARDMASENLQKPHIAAAIEAGEKAIAERNELTQDMVIQELRALGFANMQDYMAPGQDGAPYLDFSKLTREQAAALQEVTTDRITEGAGKNKCTIRRIKFKLADKRAALVDLGKHLGMFKERHEITGKDGGPITTEMTLEQATARYLEIMRGDS